MVLLSNGKLKIDNPRFKVSVIMNCKNLPTCDIKEDVIIIKDKEFFTLRDVAEFLNISYHIIVGIHHKKTDLKWVNSSLCPTISIIKI